MRYEITGGNLPVVVCSLSSGESMITESGSMAWMSPNVTMETSAGGFGKAIGRIFSGERIFQNIYTAHSDADIAFASSFPGAIKAFDIGYGNEMILQKSSFLASQSGVELSVYFSQRFTAGLFGGEGFIMQKLSGNGVAFAEFDGSVTEYTLEPGEKLVVSTGHLAAMTASCKMEIQTVKGLKNKLFGGEGFFNTVITGPGKVWIQSMPIAKVAQILIPYLPQPDNSSSSSSGRF